MIRKVQFFVAGIPKAQPRPRAFARKFSNGTVQARIYDAGTAEGWKGLIAYYARAELPPAPLDGPLRVDIDFLFDRPQRLMRKNDPEGLIWHTAKPDRDNLDKAVLDVLKTLGFFRDDAQVCAGEARKFYVAKGGKPGAMITITTISDTNPTQERPDVEMPLFLTEGA